jgi:hypothetical protein
LTTPKRPPDAKPIAQNDTGLREKLIKPVNGPISSGFGARERPGGVGSKDHKGIDYAVPAGTPVHAAASGTVTFAGTRGGYGNYVIIDHADKTQTAYAHLSDIGVQVGTRVAAGEEIGKSGGVKGAAGSGNSQGAHLHFEVAKNGVKVNPKTVTDVAKTDKAAEAKQTANDAELSRQQIVINQDQDAIIEKLISGDHFKENAANTYDNLTYHWRLYMTADSEVTSAATTTAESTIQKFYEELNSFTQVTIAETGVTTYSIDEVTMEAAVGTEFRTESTLFTSMEMKITEPNGVNFLDALRSAGIRTGTRNYMKTFYYLELSFKSYNLDGTMNLAPFADLPNGGKWVWTVQITNIDVALDAGGGSYTLQMIPLTDSLLTGSYNLIPSSIHVNGGTVGEFFDDLCSRLNNVWSRFKGGPGIIKYKPAFHPVKDVMTAEQVRALPVIPKDQDFNSERDIAFDANKTGHIAQGFTISRVLDSLMSSCEEAQKLAMDSLTPGSVDGEKAKARGYRQSIIWRIEPEVKLPNYDPIFNEYYQDITLHIYGFRHHTAVLSPQDTTSDEAAQKAILTEMVTRNFLLKKYDYLFTGQNQEVLDLDLNFNLAWQAYLPRLVEANQDQVATHAKANPNTPTTDAEKKRAEDERKKNDPQSIGSAQGESAQTANSLYEQVRALEATNPRSEEDEKKLQELRVKYKEAIAANDAQSRITSAKRAEKQAERPAQTPGRDFQREYADDFAFEYRKLSDQQKKEAFPITIQTYDPADNSGLSGQYHAGKSLYGAVLNQAYGPLATQFFRISMTVIGDPFWIGPGSFEQAIARKSETFSGSYPNHSEGANAFLFRMRYPLGQDDNGDIVLNTNETVTGVYQVNKITHKFIDGKFTQVLQANRIPIVDLYTSLYKSIYPDTENNPNDNNGGG